MAVPPRPARKMAVLPVDPPAPWAPGQIAAGCAHRPGSRRLGGVEAAGASLATAGGWPDRRKGWASPGRGPALPLHAWGLCRPGIWAGTRCVPSFSPWGRRLIWYRHKATASTTGLFLPGPYGAPLAGVSRKQRLAMYTRGTCRRAGRESVSPRGCSCRLPERVPIGAGFDH